MDTRRIFHLMFHPIKGGWGVGGGTSDPLPVRALSDCFFVNYIYNSKTVKTTF